MDNTENFVQEIHEKQQSNDQSKKKQSQSHAGHKLPGKQHSTNK